MPCDRHAPSHKKVYSCIGRRAATSSAENNLPPPQEPEGLEVPQLGRRAHRGRNGRLGTQADALASAHTSSTSDA